MTLPGLIWSEEVQEIISVDSDQVYWSPVANEYVFDHCDDLPELEQIPDQFIFVVSEPDFVPIGITPTNIFCSSYTQFEWRPDGQQILFNAQLTSSLLVESQLFDSTLLFLMDRDGENLNQTNTGGWLFTMYGFMDNNRLVHSTYSGGGNRFINIYDIETDEELAWAWNYGHFVYAVSPHYATTNTGVTQVGILAMVLTSTQLQQVPDPTPQIGRISPNVNYLSHAENVSWQDRQHLNNSRFEDWIEGTNQMLALTWPADVMLDEDELLNGEPVTDLQIWDVEADELTLVVPDAIWGRISPDRQTIIYLTPAQDNPILHLLDRINGESVFSQPVFAEIAERDDAVINTYSSFSSDSHYLTYFSSQINLVVFDLEKREVVAELPAGPFTPIWSPDSGRFVYHDGDGGLSIFDAHRQLHFPLATNGAERLSPLPRLYYQANLSPQWSYNGTYLSVPVLQENGDHHTAVLTIFSE